MRTWGYEVDRAARDDSAEGRRGDYWYVSPTGHAMAVFGHASDGNSDGGRGALATAADREVPSHRFAIGIYEITNAQFEAYSGLRPPDPLDCHDSECPAARVSWYQAAAFCNWLSERENLQRCYKTVRTEPLELAPEADCLARTGYRLPTVAEWEYACAAGSTTRWFFGVTDELYGEYAWYSENTGDLKKRHVGRKKPNAFGLFDMYGNAAEWCHDVVSDEGGYRALRGGAAGDPVRAWTHMQEAGPPDESVPAIGFRIARTVGDAR
jgi:formylglycine-generating enzyme required for sulfatase activity